MSLYERQRAGKYIFLAVAATAIIFFLIAGNSLIKELAQQERERMSIWASATERVAKANVDSDFDFLLGIISQNNSIPVLVADSAGNILDSRNYRAGTDLDKRLRKATKGVPLARLAETDPHFIRVEIYPDTYQYIYYEDSILLRRLSLYPYIQLAVMVILAAIIYAAVLYLKRAEQNRVWAGLSKETAHQLGTPISSLMAWNEFLVASGADKEVTDEIGKDVSRLSTIADRFSKIGSLPELQLEYLNESVSRSLQYMQSRISGRVEVRLELSPDDRGVMLSQSLFEWVMENLTKNAVDAMGGAGTLTVRTGADKERAWVEVSDTGKGIARKNFKDVFSPGYTTKKRGWGLGLTLVKRIIEEYHGGRIYVKDSVPGQGTTFRIEL